MKGGPVSFEDCWDALHDHERGFQCDPNDTGNWTGGAIGKGELKGTKYGISAAAFPAEDIENLTLERARHLARFHYWGSAGCDVVPPNLKFDLLDAAYHSGVRRAVKWLQAAALMPEHERDGVLGNVTLQAIQSENPFILDLRFNGHRLDFLNNNPEAFKRYGRGWTQRIAENLKAN